MNNGRLNSTLKSHSVAPMRTPRSRFGWTPQSNPQVMKIASVDVGNSGKPDKLKNELAKIKDIVVKAGVSPPQPKVGADQSTFHLFLDAMKKLWAAQSKLADANTLWEIKRLEVESAKFISPSNLRNVVDDHELLLEYLCKLNSKSSELLAELHIPSQLENIVWLEHKRHCDLTSLLSMITFCVGHMDKHLDNINWLQKANFETNKGEHLKIMQKWVTDLEDTMNSIRIIQGLIHQLNVGTNMEKV